ncbi:hypothetical protein BHK98_03880 [Hornefia porci]|uniref:Uncharacterized protein n=1 Tax=Hornefia porci TaxID=2652292 RepID=A0A1Q9JGG1_9FIRM|nr:hypothetical protein [Hornefia porci]OLR55279.1 hypothetical protein BHK98_03880 [Hornefia porci]
MITTIKISDDHSVEIDTSVNWLMIYKNQFGHDIMQDLIPLIDTLIDLVNADGEIDFKGLSENTSAYMIEASTVPQILWALARNANDVGAPESFFKWMDSFPLDIILPGMLEPILTSFVSEKNRQRLLEMFQSINPEA